MENNLKELITLLSLAVIACNSRATHSLQSNRQASSTSATEATNGLENRSAPKDASQRIQEAKTLVDAISIARPLMVDGTEQTSVGALLLASWGITNMKWNDISVKANETSYAETMKDTDRQRGRKLCVTATLGSMQPARFGHGYVYTGVMRTESGELYQYAAVGSTDNLRDTATLCGVVTGKFEYMSKSGVARQAVQIVGMFDVPENRRS
jgi:hypothetical protein